MMASGLVRTISFGLLRTINLSDSCFLFLFSLSGLFGLFSLSGLSGFFGLFILFNLFSLYGCHIFV